MISPSSDLTLLASMADWDDYRQRLCQRLKLDPTVVHWGGGPRSYPCLVASIAPAPERVVSCYVFVDDARRLLQAAGLAPGVAGPVTPPAPAQSDVPRCVRARDVDLSFIAHILTVVHFMVETGLCKQHQYEETYQRFLHEVQQLGDDSLFLAQSVVARAVKPVE